ncbi:MAG TPA: helix-turn-helix domain-containing GNAT family N-acetyltransferase [Buttiauxella sp.]|jgi:DNA-binding MarR family transcriptional regulator/N-acetylglutamate synthase-like GNAT family acetyltransferase
MSIDSSLIAEIRAASRTMVRELGFLNATLAATDYSASAVHSLLELESQEEMSAAQLVQVLGLEKSSVSRMLAKLVKAGEIAEGADRLDSRVKTLFLTVKGQKTVNNIHAFGQQQVTNALEVLNPSQQQAVAQGLAAYAQALKICRLGEAARITNQIDISTGYCPGVVGRVAEMHADYYSRNYSFGQFFESKVAMGIAEFVGRLNKPCNEIWVATRHGRVVGSVAIDGEDLGPGEAHLRWFILDEGCRGSGVGRSLIEKAVAFCDEQGFEVTHLWTFKGLNAARRLYESCGFMLALEEQGTQWGSLVTEQQFTRPQKK